MTPGGNPRPQRDRAVIWLAIALLAGGGYYAAFFRVGQAIDAQRAATDQLGAQARANAAVVARLPQIEQDENAVAAAIDAFGLHADRASTVARFIHESTRIAAAQHIIVVAIDARGASSLPVPGAQSPLGAAPARTPQPAAFETIPLDVTLRGSYSGLLTAIRALAASPVAMEIEVAAIEREGGPPAVAGNTVLDARLHVGLKRLADAAPAPAPLPSIPVEVTPHA